MKILIFRKDQIVNVCHKDMLGRTQKSPATIKDIQTKRGTKQAYCVGESFGYWIDIEATNRDPIWFEALPKGSTVGA